jgi:acyl-CoA thioesterase I
MHNHNAIADNKTPANILVLGDSLSGAYGIDIDQGWVALLQQQVYNEGYDYEVINASVSGDTTRLGGNDGLRGLAFSEIENSLSSIIERCKQAQTQILLVGVRLPPNYGPVYNQQFAQLYSSLAQRYEIPLVPKMLDKIAENRELMQQDGIHPKAEAQPQLMNNIWQGLHPLLKNKRS